MVCFSVVLVGIRKVCGECSWCMVLVVRVWMCIGGMVWMCWLNWVRYFSVCCCVLVDRLFLLFSLLVMCIVLCRWLIICSCLSV